MLTASKEGIMEERVLILIGTAGLIGLIYQVVVGIYRIYRDEVKGRIRRPHSIVYRLEISTETKEGQQHHS